MAGGTKEDSFSRATSLLADISDGRKLRGKVFQHSEQAAETLKSTIHLLESLRFAAAKETVPLDPSSTDWKALKALLELLVRLGISPHLSPGVGILRDKRQEDGQSISFQLSALSISPSLCQSSSEAPLSGAHLLFACTEVLSWFFWTSSGSVSTPQSYPPSLCTSLRNEETFAGTMNTKHPADENLEEAPSDDISTAESPIHQNRLLGLKASSLLEKSRPFTDAHFIDDTQLLPFISTRVLAMKFFLWDLMAAYLQLGFGPGETNKDIRYCARHRLQFMLEHFPVEQMVVASFVLLNRDPPTPPQWLRNNLGKHLSKLVMRRGGLVTILEELVGRATQGSVESYDKVARHLAKVPKSVASAETYLKALCPQLLPLLLTKHKPRDAVLGEISFAALNNLFYTSVSLTCKIFALEPELATNYIIKPIMRPLLAFSSIQEGMNMTGCPFPELAPGGHTELLVTENEVVDSLVQLSVLLTAGFQGSSMAKEVILHEAKLVALVLLKLHFQLDPKNCSTITVGSTRNMSSNQKKFKLEREGLKKGFLKKGIDYGTSNGKAYEDPTNVLKLCSALSDVVMAEVNQSVESALPFVLPFLLDHTLDVMRWPEEDGEIWEALQSKTFQSKSKMIYLSKLLEKVENWPLVVALMGELLNLALNAPWSQRDSGKAEYDNAAELLRYMQDFDELNCEVGVKALEYDTRGAALMVKALLDNELVLCNQDLLELVLHMVHSVLKGLRTSRENDLQMIDSHGSVLPDLSSSLESLCKSPSISERLRQMSFTLSEDISALCRGYIKHC